MNDRTIRLLLVKDDKVDQMAFERFAGSENLPYDYTISGSIAEAKEILKSISFDVIIADYMLGDGTSFELFDLLKGLPVIVITGTGNEEVAVEAMKLGAYDYLIKDPEGNYLKTLPTTVELALKRKQTEKELLKYQESLESMVKERTAQLEAEIVVRKHAEEALKLERDNLHNIFDSIEDGIYIVNQQCDIHYVNPVLVKDFGYYEGRKCYEYFHDRDEVCPWCKNQDVWAGKTVRWEWYSSKNERTYDLTDTPLTLPDGSIGKLEIFRDITTRKRMEEEIKFNKARFRELFNNMSSGVAVYEAKDNGNDFIFKDFNRAGEQIEKIKKENLIDKSVLEIFPGVKEFGFFDVLKRVWETGKPEHHPISIYKDDRIMGWRENFVCKLPSGEIVTVYDDVTERKKAEAELLLKGNVFEQSITANSTSDSDGILTHVNNAFIRTWGYENKEEAVGKPYSEFFKFEDEAKKIITALNEAGKWEGEYTALKKDGTTFVAYGLATTIKDKSGNVIGYHSAVLDISEQKLAEEVLRESKERYKALFNRSLEFVYLCDFEGNFIDANDAALEGLGYTKKDINSLNFVSFLDKDQLSPAFESVEEILKTGSQKKVVEYKLRRRDGEYIYVETKGALIYREGKPLAIQGIARDITDRKLAEEALRESEEKYRSIFENAVEGFYQSTPEGRFISVNPAFAGMIGYASSEELISSISDIAKQYYMDTEDRRRFQQLLQKDGSVEHFEFRVRCKDGSQIWVSNSTRAIYDRDGKIARYEGNVNNITLRKQAEEALRESEEKYRSMMNAMKDPVYICSPDYRIEYMNLAMIRSLGRDATGEKCFKAIHNFDEICPWCMHSKIFGNECFEYDIVSPRNSHHYHITNSPIVHKNGSISKMTVFRDTTDFIKMKEQLQQAQKMEAIGTLAGGIAHDFNNLLTTIIGNAEIALMDVIKDESLRKQIEEIKKAGQRSASLTRQLLAFSRKQVIKPEVLNINAVINDTEKMLKRMIGEDIEFQTSLEPELWKVHMDSGQIDQMIMNMVVNSRDAMPQGGKLIVETTNVDLDKNYLSEHGIEGTPGHYVMLAISDTGSGINKETQEHIFEPFFTTKEVGKGTGLGLSTVYGIAKQNNGFIWVYSEPGHGTTFKIYLPKVKEGTESEEKERTPVSDLNGSETVLVVEDDDRLRNLTRKILERYGYSVLEAENGEDALRVSEAHDGPIDLMLTDVVMPKMGGKQVAERLQPLYSQIKVIYMSGYTDNAIVHHGVLAPGLNFLEKPFTPEGLARKVREVLDAKNKKMNSEN